MVREHLQHISPSDPQNSLASTFLALQTESATGIEHSSSSPMTGPELPGPERVLEPAVTRLDFAVASALGSGVADWAVETYWGVE